MKNCNIVKDLLPLYQEDMVSEESKTFIQEHLEECEMCKKTLENMQKTTSIAEDCVLSSTQKAEVRSLQKLQEKLKKGQVRFISLLLMLGCMLLGLSFVFQENLFFNALLMPFIGILGYVVFRWTALYMTPLILTFANLIINILANLQSIEMADFYSFAVWTGIFIIFVWMGILIAGLLHFAFGKEKRSEK